MRPLLILRPQPGANATAEAARRLDLQPIVIPLFRIQSIAWTAPDPSEFDGLLLTSANAVRFGGAELQKLKRLPVCAVGEATAAAAREGGLRSEAAGDSDVDSLLASLPPKLRLLHLCGIDRREPAPHSQSVSPLPVYRSVELPIPENFDCVEGAVVAVHSPRAGRHLARVVKEAGIVRSRTSVAAISAEAATAAGDGWEQVIAASEPNERALLALAARLCQKADQ